MPDNSGSVVHASNSQGSTTSHAALRLTKHGLVATDILSSCSIAARNREHSPLLRLPAELRNQIFALVLSEKTAIPIYGDEGPSAIENLFGAISDVYSNSWELEALSKATSEVISTPSLLQVCRQIYEETSLLPYALNTFKPVSRKALNTWVSRRLNVQLACVRSIAFCEYIIKEYWASEQYAFKHTLPALKELHLDAWNFLHAVHEVLRCCWCELDDELEAMLYVEMIQRKLRKKEGTIALIINTVGMEAALDTIQAYHTTDIERATNMTPAGLDY
ncbi:hypothetical protein T440DRAFT_557310 [Plenodomus tracheiphilus IPT5]|uniref:DUF7730 domain-containing protein n=1 Tax=Plenodomus tracheiphilus IPT5 TaxID=1408161 RepID=A0A6A7AZM9_9PLEO|nr:hypothetical protein T440DRAFT_557310 [Plenodomus tracheiphilus IPT5]